MTIHADSTLPTLLRRTRSEVVCPDCGVAPGGTCGRSGAVPLPVGAVGGEGTSRCPESGRAFVTFRAALLATEDPVIGSVLAQKYAVVDRIGVGAMGAVYRARHEAMGRDVALKLVRRERAIDPETQFRFEREARALSKLKSPHTVAVYDFGESDWGWFLVMELLDGETLGERLKREGRVSWRVAARLVREALSSLMEAHSKGIVHRDLKPDNLFIARTPEGLGAPAEFCKVLDFGIAKLSAVGAQLDQLETQAGTVFGTPRYMSPEQAQGRELDARSDLYSLGVILYQAVSGRAPFVDDDAVVVMAKHIKEAPQPIARVAADVAVPSALERLIMRCLAKVPAQRPESARELAAALDEVLSDVPSSTQSSWVAPPREDRRRAPVWLVSALAGFFAVLVTAIGAAWLLVGGVGGAPQATLAPSAASAAAAEPARVVPTLPASASVGGTTGSSAAAPSASESATPTAEAVPSAAQPARRVVPRATRAARPPAPAAGGGVVRRAGDRYGRFDD